MKRNWPDYDPTVAFFPVELKPVFIQSSRQSDDLFDDVGYQALPRHFAVVESESDHVFAVVTENYKLVTNQQAYELAAEALKTVFNFTSLADMACLKIIMPKTRSFCHIDLIHKESDFEPWKDDQWIPFIRITNSYNRTHRLRFEIGFCRLTNLNEVIFESKSVEISFAHTKQLHDIMLRWHENLGEIKELEIEFVNQLRNLERFHVPRRWMLPLACKVFGVQLNPKSSISSNKIKELTLFRNAIEWLTNDYFSALGEQGYAALNVLMDYASQPVGVMSPENRIDGYQRKAGDWINDFSQQIESREFSFEKYLNDYITTSKMITEL